MSDYISRQAAIDALHMHLMYRMGTDSNKKRLDEWINNLPSAQPEPQWIPMSEREPEFGDYLTTYIEKETGKLGVTTDMYWSGGWDDDGDKFETIAWMPLPEPWEGKDMANNRIYLHCKECDEYLFLGKDYGTGLFYHDYDGKGLETKLNEFYEKHAMCGTGEPFDIRYDD